MTKQTKTKLSRIFFACIVSVFLIAGCNNGGEETKDAKSDSTTEMKTDAPPATTTDSTTMDSGDTRPVPSPN